MMSINPHNGHIKSWVGGPILSILNMIWLKGNQASSSTFKPFVYATAIESGIVDPCYEVPDIKYCIEVPHTENRNKLWCQKFWKFIYGRTYYYIICSLNSMNNITTSIIKKAP